MNRMTISDDELLRHALIGYQMRLGEIQAAMRDINAKLTRPTLGRRNEAAAVSNGTRPKRKRRRRLSPEGRAAIIAGIKKRWARVRRERRAQERAGA